MAAEFFIFPKLWKYTSDKLISQVTAVGSSRQCGFRLPEVQRETCVSTRDEFLHPRAHLLGASLGFETTRLAK